MKYISQTPFADSIPEALLSAKTECERVDLYSKLSRLTVMVQEYNTIRRPLTEAEAALFQHRMIRMETVSYTGARTAYSTSCHKKYVCTVRMYCIVEECIPSALQAV